MLENDMLLQGRYQIVRQIGHGGMGAVYLAKDQRLGSTVALKETFFSDERMLKAFEREARLLAGLRHSALPKVSDHFTEGEGQFLIMEFIPGDDLEQLLGARGHAFTPDEVMAWADQLLDALDYLHTQDPPIIHRDIKPQNLKLTARGQIILLDFGLAKGTVGEMTKVTSNASILGYTPGYAPLEQIQGAGTDARSDLYSLAATLYHLMTGATPPDALTRANAVLNGEGDPLSAANEINPHVPTGVATVLASAMALRRDERPSSAAEMRRALRDAKSTSVRVSANDAATVIADTRPTTPVANRAKATNPTPPDSATQVLASASKLSAQAPLTQAPPAQKSKRMMWAVGAVIAALVVGAVAWMMSRGSSSTANENANRASVTSVTPNANSNQATSDSANAERRNTAPSNVNAATASGTNAGAQAQAAANQNKGKPRSASVEPIAPRDRIMQRLRNANIHRNRRD